MASRARKNRPWYTIPMREGGPKWKRRKYRYLKEHYSHEDSTKENRTRANRRERRRPIETED
jgi:hypothetical protein